ncbi:hypothetical protein GCM10009665_72390 [Kitasatospora nipponensis]|uniref:Uncharacterized protein n=1 Tax=Kitasatospora nipponensis TaxID=258049 RepID=A0ABN1WZR1_9ACTN
MPRPPHHHPDGQPHPGDDPPPCSSDHCWLVELTGIDGLRYAYRVYASRHALPGDLFWSALHHHDAGPLPRVLDLFDTARIRPLT